MRMNTGERSSGLTYSNFEARSNLDALAKDSNFSINICETDSVKFALDGSLLFYFPSVTLFACSSGILYDTQ